MFTQMKDWLFGDTDGATASSRTDAHVAPVHIIRRFHVRAKRLKLSIRAGKVWLTIPPNATETQIQRFLTESNDWLQGQLAHIQAQTPTATMSLAAIQIPIPLLNTTWTVALAPELQHAVELANVLHTPETDSVWHIREHVRQQAKIYLPNRLQLLSESSGLSFHGSSVRHATTRWGSCSARKTISLNAALLLLPTPLIDYVLLHELCHTIEMNHSAAFWQQMSRVMPDWAVQRHALKHHQLPVWWTQGVAE